MLIALFDFSDNTSAELLMQVVHSGVLKGLSLIVLFFFNLKWTEVG